MENQNLFVPLPIAKKLKAKGFNKHCLAWYCNDMNILYANLYNGNPIEGNKPPKPKQLECYAPLYQQVIDWLREEHSLIISTTRDGGWWFIDIIDFSNEDEESPLDNVVKRIIKDDYYETLNEAIEEALKLLK